ncbi:DUF4870 domain-containing protein [Flavobacterium antarcticum]|uniref:DUF4870 domain-containing protein n=1 Tax=Flavobacterium antarcticum TaxID=271155 RepID=UPI0003B564A2|nr:membrane protein [Flavobacterium antarcticum]
MDTFQEGKKIATISYITIIGTIIAFTMNSEKKNDFAAFHIRQALGIFITFFAFGYIIGYFNSWMITSAFWVFIFVLWMYGFLGALEGKKRLVPIVGPLYQKLFTAKK